MQSLSANKPNMVHQCGVFLLVLLLTASHLIKSNAADGIYLSPDSGTYDKDQVTYITASEAPAYVSPNGEQCCGGGQDGTYEFYDIEYTGWSGDVVDPAGNGAGLDTSSPGSKTVTCNGLMKFRCSGGEDIAGPISVSGTGTYTVREGVKANMSPTGVVYAHVDEDVEFSTSPSGGSGNYSWQWFVDDVVVGTDSTFTTSWSDIGEHKVKVVVSDTQSSSNTDNEEVSVRTWELKQQPLAEVSSAAGSAAERTTFGVNEEIQFSVEPTTLSVTWTSSGYGQLSNQTGNSTIYSGHGQAGQATITAQPSGGAPKQRQRIFALPTGLEYFGHNKITVSSWPAGSNWVDYEVGVGVVPDTMSWTHLELKEQACNASNVNPPNIPVPGHTPNPPFFPAAAGQNSTFSDFIGGATTPTTTVSYTWAIQWLYHLAPGWANWQVINQDFDFVANPQAAKVKKAFINFPGWLTNP